MFRATLRFLIYSGLSIFILLPHVSFALEDVTLPDFITEDPSELYNEYKEPFFISSKPSYPKPNEEVELTLESYGNQYNPASISWFLNGKPIANSVGKRSITTAGIPYGASQHFSVVVESVTEQYVAEYILTPQIADVIIESDTTILFFDGKALVPEGDTVHVSAVFHTNKNNEPYAYEWHVGQVSSGGVYKGQHASFVMPGRKTTLTLYIKNNEGAEVYARGFNLIPALPKIRIYPFTNTVAATHPLAQPVYIPTSDTETYYVSVYNQPLSADANWRVNGKNTPLSQETPDLITIHNLLNADTLLGYNITYGTYGGNSVQSIYNLR